MGLAQLQQLKGNRQMTIMNENDNNHFERVLGKEGCGVMNENGLRLVEMCAQHNLVKPIQTPGHTQAHMAIPKQ